MSNARYRPPAMNKRDHARLWRLVEGAVIDAFRAHPDYLTETGQRAAVKSITKRVTGQIAGHAQEARKRSRSVPVPGGSRGDTGGVGVAKARGEVSSHCSAPIQSPENSERP